MEQSLFETLVRKLEALLQRLRDLKEENRSLRQALQEKESLLERLTADYEAAETARSEGRTRLEALLKRIEEELG